MCFHELISNIISVLVREFKFGSIYVYVFKLGMMVGLFMWACWLEAQKAAQIGNKSINNNNVYNKNI